jgi:eukaryotic-like serine/threonine-protein kinase
MPIAAGRRMGPYEVLSAIGAGGMGEVYRARDPRLGRDVALKVLPREHSGDPDRLRRFRREAQVLAALSHPNILALHDAGSSDGTAYAIFELLEDETLRQKLDRGPVAPRKVVEWGAQICRGLAAAHVRGIVHCDLKPENLAFAADGSIKILDFGLARLTDTAHQAGLETKTTRTATQAGVVLGTAGYMSPEQARGRLPDARSDLFAVGAMLYEMITGRRAFDGPTAADTISAVLHRDPPEATRGSEPVPAGLERIVRRCLEKDPDDRFQTARDLGFALERLSGSSASWVPVPVVSESRRPWTRAGVAAVLAALATGALLWPSRRVASPGRS